MNQSEVAGRTVVLGADEASTVVDDLDRLLTDLGFNVVLIGPPAGTDEAWAEVGLKVGNMVADGDAAFGVVACWTGTGVAIAANKVPGVRAALVTDAETARGARRWNDANVLAVSLRLLTPALASEIVGAWVATEVDPSELGNIALVEPTTTTSTKHG
ncbi:MAG: RpiB/LacA/LacB family sugar-phosphate isomerase [Acidimicrobiia bacterium]|jgi:ribose 5-phosphate isomerase B|nr:RpiB/LacA/LacB family sugar-phosphate isomerase [Acidimicrobiia bacterium]MBP8181486.1 RpiB/LacA/LacB family sugar-phosphate isomerase [Acidimicrobiia bacterium]